MNAELADRLVRALAETPNRRAFGVGILAGLFGVAGLEQSSADVDAARKRKRRRREKRKKQCDPGAVKCNGKCCVPGQTCFGILGCINGTIPAGDPCDPSLAGECNSGVCGCDGDDCFCRVPICSALGGGCLIPIDCCSGTCPGATSCTET